MRRLVIRSCSLWAVLAVLAASGWGGATRATTPVTPTATSVTEEFTGTLNINGGASFPFIAQAAGLITATLTTLGPDSTMSVGLSLGTWNGTSCAVASIHNDNAGAGFQHHRAGHRHRVALHTGLRRRQDCRVGRLHDHGRSPVSRRAGPLNPVLVDLPTMSMGLGQACRRLGFCRHSDSPPQAVDASSRVRSV